MKYHLCFKDNDKNLLHIVSDKDLKSPRYKTLKSFKKTKDEEAAFKKVEDLARSFCEESSKNGNAIDFSQFKAWLLKEYK